MESNKRRLGSILFFPVFLLLLGCATRGPEMSRVGSGPEAPTLSSVKSIPSFDLPMPQGEKDKAYLGLEGTGNFQLGQVKAPFVIIEVFSFYCPYCQQVAPKVNELYQKIEARPDLKGKIKLIGIGSTNSSFEVNSFREKYQVPFPLFPDQNKDIFNLLGARGTPTFVGIRLSEKGGLEQFYLGEGAFQDSQQVLAEIVKLAGLEEARK